MALYEEVLNLPIILYVVYTAHICKLAIIKQTTELVFKTIIIATEEGQ
jgi:hypothetical protein